MVRMAFVWIPPLSDPLLLTLLCTFSSIVHVVSLEMPQDLLLTSLLFIYALSLGDPSQLCGFKKTTHMLTDFNPLQAHGPLYQFHT